MWMMNNIYETHSCLSNLCIEKIIKDDLQQKNIDRQVLKKLKKKTICLIIQTFIEDGYLKCFRKKNVIHFKLFYFQYLSKKLKLTNIYLIGSTRIHQLEKKPFSWSINLRRYLQSKLGTSTGEKVKYF